MQTKNLLLSIFSAFIFFGLTATASAADMYWIGADGANFNTVGNWSNTSGGASNGTIPGPADDAIFDGASGALINTPTEILGILMDPAFSGTLTVDSPLELNGSIFIAGGTIEQIDAADTITVADNWGNGGGTYIHNGVGVVQFSGPSPGIFGNNNFFDVIITGADTSTVFFTMEASTTQTIEGTFTAQGNIDDLYYIQFRSSVFAQTWFLDALDGNHFEFTFADIQDGEFLDSNASGINISNLFGTIDSGLNTGFDFQPEAFQSFAISPLDGTTIADTTPDLNFDMGNTGIRSRYFIEIDNDNNFASPLLSYVSEWNDFSDIETFTVGQIEGSSSFNTTLGPYCDTIPCNFNGEYLIGNAGQSLPNGNYYWRIRTQDENGMLSFWFDAFNSPIRSFNLGGNINMYWIGNNGDNFDDVGNWSNTSGGPSNGQVPGVNDTAILDSANGAYLGNGIQIGELQLTGSFSGTLQLDSGLEVYGDLILDGGTLEQISSGIFVYGDWNRTATNYIHNNVGGVTFFVSNQTIYGNNNFWDLDIELSNFHTGNGTLSFEAGSTQTIENGGDLLLRGDADSFEYINLRSTSDGVEWFIDGLDGDIFTMIFADIKDSNFLDSNASGIPIGDLGEKIFGTINSGNNTNYNFLSANSLPSNLGAADKIDGSEIFDYTPDLEFEINDFIVSKQRYQIQIDTNSSFSSPDVNYISEFADFSGVTTFTVGQPKGSNSFFELFPPYCTDNPCVSDGFYADGFSGQSLSNGNFFWRVRLQNNGGMFTDWVEGFTLPTQSFNLGGPLVPPNAPTNLGPANRVNGSLTNNNSPTLNFELSDPDGGATLKFTIQIDNNSDFSSPEVNYTSALAAQGVRSFSVGQALNGGTYTTGTVGQDLADGSYYWRVKAINNNDSESAFTTANTGNIAFVVDTIIPVITRLGTTPVNHPVGTAYVDAGATASDNIDGNITGSIVTVNPVNTGVLGAYTVTYNVTDAAGNAAVQVSRTVNVIDTVLPVITLTGSNPINITQGTPYTDAGATASDNYDGNITGSIVTVNPVNINVPGTYTITYNVADSSTNDAIEVTRTVNVSAAPSGGGGGGGGGSLIILGASNTGGSIGSTSNNSNNQSTNTQNQTGSNGTSNTSESTASNQPKNDKIVCSLDALEKIEAKNFSDTNDHWAKSLIQKLSTYGVLTGYLDGTFKPNASITRAEFTTVVLKVKNQSQASRAAIPFTDVTDSDWFKKTISQAWEYGFVEGYVDGSFKPNAQITRAEGLKILIEACNPTFDREAPAVNFTDVNQSTWFADYVNYGFDRQIIEGYPAADGSKEFRPNSPLSRAEAIKLIDLILSLKK